MKLYAGNKFSNRIDVLYFEGCQSFTDHGENQRGTAQKVVLRMCESPRSDVSLATRGFPRVTNRRVDGIDIEPAAVDRRDFGSCVGGTRAGSARAHSVR